MPAAASEGGLGQALIGEKILVNQTTVAVKELLGEGMLKEFHIFS
jgi:hypothetical protein